MHKKATKFIVFCSKLRSLGFQNNNIVKYKKIIKILSAPTFVMATSLLLLHQIWQQLLGQSYSFFDAYLDDFLALPFILSIFLVEQLIWNRRVSKLTALEVIVFTVVFGLFFEEVVPKLHESYTKDYWDYLAYSLGSILFYLTVNQSVDDVNIKRAECE